MTRDGFRPHQSADAPRPATMTRRHLPDHVWCVTCQHTHIPTIPAVTYRCDVCGFGAWFEDMAGDHADAFPDHVVYATHHQTVDKEYAMAETAQQQIDRLAAFISETIPGEPSQSQGAVDTAIRLLTP